MSRCVAVELDGDCAVLEHAVLRDLGALVEHDVDGNEGTEIQQILPGDVLAMRSMMSGCSSAVRVSGRVCCNRDGAVVCVAVEGVVLEVVEAGRSKRRALVPLNRSTTTADALAHIILMKVASHTPSCFRKSRALPDTRRYAQSP